MVAAGTVGIAGMATGPLEGGKAEGFRVVARLAWARMAGQDHYWGLMD